CRRRVCGNFVANHPPGFEALTYRRSLWVDCADKCFTTVPRYWPSERSQDRSDEPGNTRRSVVTFSQPSVAFFAPTSGERRRLESGKYARRGPPELHGVVVSPPTPYRNSLADRPADAITWTLRPAWKIACDP